MKCAIPTMLIVLVLSSGQGVSLENGQVLQGDFTSPGEEYSYDLVAAAGDTLKIRMSYPEDSGIAEIDLVGPGGEPLDHDWSDFKRCAGITTAVTNDGTYTVICRDHYGTHTGQYYISMIRMTGYPLSSADPDTGPISNGLTLSGRFDAPGDLDASTLQCSAGDTVQIRIAYPDSGGVAEIYLFGPDGSTIAHHWSDYRYRAQVTTTVPDSGTYTVVVKDHYGTYTGQYNLAAIRMSGYPLASADSDIGPIGDGETVTGNLDFAGDLDAATFAAVSGDVATVRMDYTDARGVAEVQLFGPQGTSLAYNWSDFAKHAQVTHPVTTSGIYTAVAKGYYGKNTGSYQLTLTLENGCTINDIDNDGVSNTDELRSWTDPFDPGSFFGMTRINIATANCPAIRWQTVGSLRYRVQYSDDLESQPFTDITRPETEELETDVSAGQMGQETFVDDFTAPQGEPPGNTRFYKVRIVE